MRFPHKVQSFVRLFSFVRSHENSLVNFNLKKMENQIKDQENKDDCEKPNDREENKDLESEMGNLHSLLDKTLHIDGQILKNISLDGIIDYMLENNVKNIITMAGAGISTSAGIPDFRSPETGLYHKLEKYNLPNEEAIFEINFFKSNPKPFYKLAKTLIRKDYKPTLTHYFIRLLHEKGLLLRHYTQNIDNLERMAGIPDEKLVEAHGTFNTSHCLDCHEVYEFDWLKNNISKGTVPTCEKCKEGIVKPDIIFFGEMLPDRFHTLISSDFPKADLLIIMGSGLTVQPFSLLIDDVPSTCPRLLINKEKVGTRNAVMKYLGLSSGLDFSSGRDVAWLGDCDTGCKLFADKFGIGKELDDLISKERQRLDDAAAAAEEASVNNEKASN